MNRLDRWIQGIHKMCPACKKVQQGVVVIFNDDASGETVRVHIECCHCGTNMMNVLTTEKETIQGELNV